MSTPGRSDTWCAPSGTRSSRSSRPCNSRQEGRSESTSDMRTGRTRSSQEVPDTPPSNASWDVIPANKPAITKMAADEVPPPRGPLTVVATTARKGPTKAYSMHLLDTEPEVYLGCTRCFRHFTFPSTWTLRSTGLRGLHLPLLGHRRERGHSVGQGGGRPPGN